MVPLKTVFLFVFRTNWREVASSSSLQFGPKTASSESKRAWKTRLSSCKVSHCCTVWTVLLERLFMLFASYERKHFELRSSSDKQPLSLISSVVVAGVRFHGQSCSKQPYDRWLSFHNMVLLVVFHSSENSEISVRIKMERQSPSTNRKLFDINGIKVIQNFQWKYLEWKMCSTFASLH